MKCDICGQPACVEVCDLTEIEPTKGDDGNWWQTFADPKPEDRHYFCEQHKVEASVDRTIADIWKRGFAAGVVKAQASVLAGG